MNDLPTPQPTKQSFYNVSLAYHSDEHILRQISKNAGADIMLKMIAGVAVRRAEAEKVLVAFSAYTGRTQDLTTVQVVLMPTFKEVYGSYQLSLDDLSGPTKFYQTTINQMLNGKPVLHAYAVQVLAQLSEHVGKQYTLETVDVALIGPPEAEV